MGAFAGCLGVRLLVLYFFSVCVCVFFFFFSWGAGGGGALSIQVEGLGLGASPQKATEDTAPSPGTLGLTPATARSATLTSQP